MSMRLILLLFCLLAAAINPAVAKQCKTNRDLLTVSADSSKMERVYKMAPTEELNIMAQRIYKVNKYQAEKMQTPPPEELTDEILHDRNKLIEYIKNNSKQ